MEAEWIVFGNLGWIGKRLGWMASMLLLVLLISQQVIGQHIKYCNGSLHIIAKRVMIENRDVDGELSTKISMAAQYEQRTSAYVNETKFDTTWSSLITINNTLASMREQIEALKTVSLQHKNEIEEVGEPAPTLEYSPRTEPLGYWTIFNGNLGNSPTAVEYPYTALYKGYFYTMGGKISTGYAGQEVFRVSLKTYGSWERYPVVSEYGPSNAEGYSGLSEDDGYFITMHGHDCCLHDQFKKLNLNHVGKSDLHMENVNWPPGKPARLNRGAAVVWGDYFIWHGGDEGTEGAAPSNLQQQFYYVTHRGTPALFDHTAVPGTPSARIRHQAVLYKDYMYLAGGNTGSPNSEVHRIYLPEPLKGWTQLPNMNRERHSFCMFASMDKIWFAGGVTSTGPIGTFNSLDIHTNIMRDDIRLLTRPGAMMTWDSPARHTYSCSQTSDGQHIVAFAGRDPSPSQDFGHLRMF